MKRLIFLLTVCAFTFSITVAQNVRPVKPLPTERQLEWSKMEFYLFVHFGPNTFTDLEWGKGTEHEEVFNPSNLDCRQWCRIAKAAGAKGIIITAKHHDGFCLWPSKYSKHTVAQSKWKNGKGDVLQELRDACNEYGLKMGVYLSPWDRNHPAYGTDLYNDVFVNMMKEIVEKYGPFFEFWWDGANGEGPNGKKQVYDFPRFEKLMRTIAPNTVVFSDIGPDIRWVGNENGIAGKTNWDFLDTAGFTRGAGGPPQEVLNSGNENGKNWIPAECDVSIRPGWFYHQQEDSLVKSPEKLFQLYLKSVGRGSSFLLNVPPDRTGQINEHDSTALVGFKKLRDESFSTPVAEKDFSLSMAQRSYTANIGSVQMINCVLLREPIQLGQRVKSFSVELLNKGKVVYEMEGTTIGNKRILTFPKTEADGVRIIIKSARAPAVLSKFAAYLIDEKLLEKD
ncbi:MAG: alpha-L-fucosidase [Bacteroidetes bacterium]|nr:alpha-L-fucosidase [Bacteroidota bacterium]